MIKTVTLTGTEVEVSDLGGQNVAVKNLGGGAIYASPYPNVAAGADNVVEIPAGGGEVVLDANGTVYLLGTGRAQCTGTPYATPNFKMPSSSASGGGGGVIGGTFTIASMNDDPDILHMYDVPKNAEDVAKAISELTGLERITKPIPNENYVEEALVIGNVGMGLPAYDSVAPLVNRTNGWFRDSAISVFYHDPSSSSVIVDAFVKDDLIAFGLRADASKRIGLQCLFAKTTEGEWLSVIQTNSIQSGSNGWKITHPSGKVYDMYFVGRNDLTAAEYKDTKYSPEPTVWLYRCPTMDFGGAIFKSLYAIAASEWSKSVIDTIFRDEKLVGTTDTFLNIGNSESGSFCKLFIRK